MPVIVKTASSPEHTEVGTALTIAPAGRLFTDTVAVAINEAEQVPSLTEFKVIVSSEVMPDSVTVTVPPAPMTAELEEPVVVV